MTKTILNTIAKTNMNNRAERIDIVDVSELKEHPKNCNIHTPEQIERLAEIIRYQGFRNPIVVSRRSGFVVQGHGRLMAARRLGMSKVPVIFQEFDSEEQEYASLVSDNAIASWARLDLAKINAELPDLGPEFNVDLLGIEGFTLDPAENNKEQNAEHLYTRKIDPPTYEPSGEKPRLDDLYDTTKYAELLRSLDSSNVSEDEKAFLRLAATRHIVFKYSRIADYYAHSPAEVQRLFEDSALVVVDYEDAIKNGFVKMSQTIANIAASELDTEDSNEC